jgi:hypothetical protein
MKGSNKMAKKSTSKRISVNAFEKAYKEMNKFTEDRKVEWGGLEITIHPTLSLPDMMLYVKEVVQGCFIGPESEYHPEVREFLNSVALVTYYTDITLPSNTKKVYEMLYNSKDLLTLVVAEINQEQFADIQTAIDNQLTNYNSVATSIAIRQLETVSSAVEGLEDRFAEIFGGINGSDLSAAVKAIGENGFSEEALVSAVLKNRGETIDENKLEQR